MRFVGTIESFARVDVSAFVDWLSSVPVEDWRKTADADWDEWGGRFGYPLADKLTKTYYPGCRVSGIGIFVLEPGQVHPAHKDEQNPSWVTRVHVPLITSDEALIIMDDGEHRMEVGKAYRFNTLATHAVVNLGKTHRAHFVFDIVRK